MKMFRMHYCLLLTLATLAVGHQASAGSEATPGAAAKPAPKAVALSGKVLETMDGGGYTYLLLKNGADKVWVAVPLFKAKVGQELTLRPGYEFKNFNSKGLNRTFDRVIFSAGVVDQDIQLSPSALKMAHEGAKTPPSAAAAAPAKPSATGTLKNNAGKKVPLSIQQVAKAKGPNSYTIAQLYAKRDKLEKKPIVVRGKVVKVSSRIMKRNWIHIKDGSGSESKKNNDIVVTSVDLPEEGDVITVKGTLYNRIDFGSGYRFELMVQDAKIKKR
jgi:hypothetical protein